MLLIVRVGVPACKVGWRKIFDIGKCTAICLMSDYLRFYLSPSRLYAVAMLRRDVL